jgi:DNA adenine methylase
VLTYLDPPYDPVSSTASFTAYDGIPFDRDDQRRLSGVAVDWAACGAHVVASNSDTAFVRSLYPGFDRHEVRVLRKINRRLDKRGRVGELVLVKRPA